ncbi:TonB-dependent receptor plug domain-containing protein [Janthinobacterium sp. Mn2066]|uniref:TonB-dependent receptor plug domain-containing protein n=1 Tax=Janthinobacterium sp. Mn2066 TaxID=3395264 RepID=UPI003BDE440C
MFKKIVLKQSVVAVAMTLVSSQLVYAQLAPQEPVLEKILVTGSNLKRADKEGTSPVDVITAKDIKESGASTVAELMKLVPSMGTDTNQDQGGGTGFARGVATASLRGLGSSSTLILLNGRRMTPSAYADPNNGNSTLYDLNSIPLSALDRVEILKDGASAVYGSDAIGGVINFITKSNYQGAQIAANRGANDDDRFRRKNINGFFGKGDIDADGYNVFLALDFSERDRVARRDVKDIDYDTYQRLNGRFRSDYSSSVSKYAAAYRESSPGSRNFGVTQANAPARLTFNLGCDPAQQITGGVKDGLLPTSVLIGRTFCNYNADQFLEGTGAGRDTSLLSRGTLKISDKVTGYAEAAYTRSVRAYTGAPSTIGTTSVTNYTATGLADPFQAILPIGHPDNPYTDARASVAYRFENLRGGSETINQNARLLTGLQGDHFGWSWDTGLLWNRSKRDETQYGRLYLPTLRKLNTGTSLAQLAADPTIGYDTQSVGAAEIFQLDGKASTEFGKLGGGAIGLALGFELRREKIRIDPDNLVATGQIYGVANTIIDGQRDVKSAFVELRTPFTKNFEMDFAGRVDKYPGIKTNFVPKVGTKWTVTDTLALRGTYAEGFRAPALSQVTPGGAQFFLNGVWDPKRCQEDESTPRPGGVASDCSKSISGVGGANPDLKPETSKSYSLGLIYSPTSDIDLVLDVYRVRKEKEVALGTADEALKNEDRAPQNVIRDQNPANFITDANGRPIPGTGPLLSVKTPWSNQGSTELRGVDFETRLRNKLGEWGSLSTALRGTYVYSYKLEQHEGDFVSNVAGTRPGLYDWQLSTGTDMPKLKASLTTSWSRGDHSINASVNYVGTVSLKRNRNGDNIYSQPFCYYGTKKPTDAAPDRNTSNPGYEDAFPDCKVASWTTIGLGYTYTGFKNLSLAVNIQNLFDRAAPYDPGYSTVGYNEGLHNNYGRYFNFNARYTF